jgi:hypothetical protein
MSESLKSGRWWIWRQAFPTPVGYEYVGPCRCGFGPNAFYRTREGRILHASQLFFPFTGPMATLPALKPEDEKKFLEEEAKALQEELKRVDERLKELKN